ncbi:hypothetical protein JCM10207_005808 [Rhodosporidiobolus poonsookiae]
MSKSLDSKEDFHTASPAYAVDDATSDGDYVLLKPGFLYHTLPFGYSRNRLITRFGGGFAHKAAAVVGGFSFCVSAYNLASFGGVLGNPVLRNMLGLVDGSSDYLAAKEGGIVCLNPLGMIIGALLGGILSNSVGRTKSISCGLLLSLFGAALQTGSQSITWFSIARVLNGMGVGIADATVPTWIGELSKTNVRSGAIAFELLFAGIGVSIATWLGYGFGFVNDYELAWRFPVGAQMAVSVCLFALIHFLPESPRWLISAGKMDDAAQVLAFIHGEELAQAELAEVVASCREQKAEGAPNSYWSMFVGKQNVRRQICITFLCQFTGTFALAYGMILSYASTVFGFAGYNSEKIALLNGGNAVSYGSFFLVGVLFADKVGARNLMVWGAAGAGVMMMIIGGLSKLVIKTESSSAGAGLVACVFIYAAFHGSSFATCAWVLPAEIFNQATRSRGAAVSIAIFSFGNGLSTMLAPFLFNALNENFFFLFGSLTLASVPILYAFLPQTAGRSLEDLTHLLSGPALYWRAEKHYAKYLASKEGNIVVA